MLLPALPVTVAVVGAVLLLMLVESQLSLANDRALRARGAVEPRGDVFRLMRVAYPGLFVLIGLEGALHPALPRRLVLGGMLLFGVAKVLKFWAMASLGRAWSYRVLIVPGDPLVSTGPYRVLRHPNYVAVLGEIVAVALALDAPFTGAVATLTFGWLLLRRIAVEDRALGRR
jgi:methyltransferase